MAEPLTLTGRRMVEYATLAKIGIGQAIRQTHEFENAPPRSEAEWMEFYRRVIRHDATLFETMRQIDGILDIIQSNGLLSATGDPANILRDGIRRMQQALDGLEAGEK